MCEKLGEGREKIMSSVAPPPITGEVGAWVLLKACVREMCCATPSPPWLSAGKNKFAEVPVPGVVFDRNAELGIGPELPLVLPANAGV